MWPDDREHSIIAPASRKVAHHERQAPVSVVTSSGAPNPVGVTNERCSFAIQMSSQETESSVNSRAYCARPSDEKYNITFVFRTTSTSGSR